MKKFSFSKRERISENSRFRQVFFKGRLLKFRDFEIRYLKTSRNFSRLGIALARKVGNAPKRNKIKRIVREWFRHNKRNLVFPADLIFFFRKKIADPFPKNLGKNIGENMTASELFSNSLDGKMDIWKKH